MTGPTRRGTWNANGTHDAERAQRVRWAVIGAGHIAQVAVLPAFANATENSELVALVSGDPEKRGALLSRYPSVARTGTYAELEEVLEAADVDAAYIALPNHLHREYTLRCAAAGVHVLCEKPMAMSAADCQAMIEACDDADVKLMIAYRLHYEEAYLRALDVVRSGRVGDPRFFTSTLSQQVAPGDIRTRGETGGGALYDLGIYCVNAARSFFEDEPTDVFAWQIMGRDARSAEVDECTAALLRFPGGRIAQFVVSQGAGATSTLSVVGTEGSLRLDPAYAYAKGLELVVTIDDDAETITVERHDQFAPELVAFSRAILLDEVPASSGHEGLADVRVLEAIAESARTGRPVPLEPSQRQPTAAPAAGTTTRTGKPASRPAVEPPDAVNAPAPSR